MNRYLVVFIIVSFLAVASLIVYAKNSPKAKEASSAQELTKFDTNSQNGANPTQQVMNQPQVTELKIEDIQEGTGSAIKAGEIAEVNYVGTLLDGRKFDSSYDRNETFEFPLGAGQVIQGWDEGVVGMKVGGKRKLIVPSDMAYGPRGAGGIIGPNTPLVFEVELISIK